MTRSSTSTDMAAAAPRKTFLPAPRLAPALSAAIIALGLAGTAALPAAAQQNAPATARAPKGPVKVDPGVLLKFVRSTMIALDQANKTGNYTVLRDIGSPDFQKANTAARLSEIFASERQAGLDLSSAAIIEPVYTLQPEINANGFLHFAGYFPAGNDQLRFEYLFQAVGSSWRLFGVSVTLNGAGGNAAPAAASEQPAAPAAPPVPAPKPKAHGKPTK